MSIGGQKRETTNVDYSRKIGLFEGEVIAINPSREQYQTILGMDLPEDSKADEYLGESSEGNTRLKIDVWFKKVDDDSVKMKTSFFLEDKIRMNKDETKTQFINSVGQCSWASDESELPKWFTENREVREAYAGEELFYNFLRSWLSNLDYRHADTVLTLEWKKLMKGNVTAIQNEIAGEWANTLGVLSTVSVKEVDEEVKQFQNIYNKAFLPAYALKQFRLVDYDDRNVQASLLGKTNLKGHERFVLNVISEYGCKDYYILKDLQDFDSSVVQAVSSEGGEMEDDDPNY